MLIDALRTHARDLLSSGKVSCVVGYENGTKGRTRPAFIYDPDDVDRLVWNQYCTHNLTTYLPAKIKEGETRVSVVLKPCDSKAFNVLLSEGRVNRQQVDVIGVVCPGILDETANGQADPGVLQFRCLNCDHHTPYVYDQLFGEPEMENIGSTNGAENGIDLDEMSAEERQRFWMNQFVSCIRCYACRQVCPMCSCPTCLYERDDSMYIGLRSGIKEKRAFHLGRAMHLAGRCIGCDECERVCPMNIPIGLLNQALAKEIKLRHTFTAGIEPTPSPINCLIPGEGKT